MTTFSEESAVEELKDMVFRALNNAKANGYDMSAWSAEKIAQDIADMDADCAKMVYNSETDELDHEIMIPFIEEWRNQQ